MSTNSEELLTQLIEEQRALRAEFQEKATSLFKQVTTNFFEQNPGIKAIVWNQYSPYFNDGDECVFSVNEPYFTNAEGEELENVSCWGEYEGEDDDIFVEGAWSLGKEPHEGVNAASVKWFSDTIQSSDLEPILYDMFDNHVSVTATINGFEVTECDHD